MFGNLFLSGKEFSFSSHKEKLSFGKHRKKRERACGGIFTYNFFLTKENAVSILPPRTKDSLIPLGGTLSTQNTHPLFKWMESIT